MVKHYYCAQEVNGGWKGRVYKYDPSGNREITVWISSKVQSNEAAACDDATEWAEEHDVDVELS